MVQELMGHLVNKGYCVSQHLLAAEDIARMHEASKELSFSRVPSDFEPFYLGTESKEKQVLIDLDAEETPAAVLDSPIAARDGAFGRLCGALTPQLEECLGIRITSRTNLLARMTFEDDDEEADFPSPAEPTSAERENFMSLMKRKRLCLMHFLGPLTGRLTLAAKGEGEEVEIEAGPGVEVAFLTERFQYSHSCAEGRTLALQCWLLGQRPEFQMGDIGGDMEVLGASSAGASAPPGETVAVNGMGVCLGADSKDYACYWLMFNKAGGDTFVETPMLRWDVNTYCMTYDMQTAQMQGLSYTKHQGYVDGIEYFDAKFFGVSNAEAASMDPNQRKCMENVYESLHMGGHDLKGLQRDPKHVGVFVGISGSEWGTVPHPNDAAGCGSAEAIISNRCNFSMNLKGPSQTINTACSAGLVAMHTAKLHLKYKDFDPLVAVIGCGINFAYSPLPFIGCCSGGMLSYKGRSFTFDVAADGYGRGEGVSSVYMNLMEYSRDVFALVAGSQANQDGRSASITAPNGPSQEKCIKAAFREASLKPPEVDCFECHGTGTALGDPIEVGALRGVMEPRETPLLATSSKSNLGHMEACAGLVGLLKCILMVMTSNGPPNIHLCDLNPHLDVDGFPTYFETEHCETRLNSNYAGVSSFGFSGTNARADVWSQCKAGPRRTGGIDLSVVDQVHVRCPVTMGLIEHLTGEPVTRSFRQRRKYKADVLREEWAPYDVSSYAYEGAFRYRREPLLDAQDEDLDPEVGVGICGSWSGWTRTERMQPQGGGWYAATVALGEGRYELFHIRLGEKDKGMLVYPAIPNASQRIWVEGPGASQEGRNWIIDGRDLEVPSGTLYEIRFRWHSERMAVQWEPIVGIPINPVAEFEHCYCLLGTFSSGQLHDMRRVAGEEGTWEGSFRLGVTGTEEFQISRDGDMGQLIYPAQPQTLRTTVPVRGPDGMGKGKRWLVRGPTGDGVTVRLRILDAHIAVTVASEVKGAKVYESVEGWERHQYSVVGSWTNWAPVAMVPDAEAPGVFRAFAKLGEMYSSRAEAFVELFQVVVDDDAAQAFHPMVDGSDSGQHIVLGPDGDGDGKNWAVLSAVPNARFEICLDLTAVDRRKMVTWTWMTSPLGYGDY